MLSAQELLRLRWEAKLERAADGAPLLPHSFVAAQGEAVQIADVRPEREAFGPLGYIPGSAFPGAAHLEELARSGSSSPLVLVCGTGEASAKEALRLEAMGMSNVAAMAGGLAAWRGMGLATSRDPLGLRRDFYRRCDAAAAAAELSLDRVGEHLGDPRSVRWIKLASMVAHGSLSCIDGRDERGVVGTPGGDGGEFLLTLAAIEEVTGERLDDATVKARLQVHLDTFGLFYMHTDVHAFERLIEALAAEPRLKSATSGLRGPVQWTNFLRHVPEELRETLLTYLLMPAHNGCGHIRLMMQHSEEYGIRRELVLAFLRALHELWWEGAPEVQLTALRGDHQEAGVVNVRFDDDLWGLSQVPLISPSCGGRQMFIHHPDVATFLRGTTVRALIADRGPLGIAASEEARLTEAMASLAERQLNETVGRLAAGLPVFDAYFRGDGSFELKGS